jgi:predicted RecA/RadA family phage recombinase
MKNYKQPGDVLTLVAPYTVLSGAGAKRGAIFGVAESDTLINVSGEFKTEGVFSLAKTSAQAWVAGERVYWDDANKRCDTDSAVGMLIGSATAVAANPSSTGLVKLNGGATSELFEGAQAAEADIVITAPNTQGGATPTAAQVDTGITNTVAPVLVKINALLAKLRIAGILDT